LIHTALGERDKAFRWIGQCAAERDFWTVWLPIDPRLDSLRDDPRYADAVKKIVPIDAEDTIHQSYVPTKILPAVEAKTLKRVEEKAEEKSFEVPARRSPRRNWLYAVLAAAIPALLIFAVFVGLCCKKRRGKSCESSDEKRG